MLPYRYPYIASRLLTDSAEELQGALQQLLFTKEDEPRWDRLEELLERADSVTDYSLAEAAERLIVYVVHTFFFLSFFLSFSLSLFLSFSLSLCSIIVCVHDIVARV